MRSNLLRVEFHCHTNYSRDSLTSPGDLVKACIKKQIDRMVVTDHNTINGALAAQRIAPERVIVGEEIMTTDGELLAAYVQEEIPPYLSPLATIKRLQDQGAFISVSHPFDRIRSGGWSERNLVNILPYLDAIEVFNSRCIFPIYNSRAHKFAEQVKLPGTVGSDAHGVFELGRSVLLLKPFKNPDELRKVIRSGLPIMKWSPPWIHLISRYAVISNTIVRRQPG